MAKNKSNSTFESILGLFALIGGTLIGLEILKSMSKKEIVYDCPVCKYPVKFGTISCPNCNSHLTWPE